MDTVRRRRCETCIFHQQGPSSCTGTCLNLQWQPMGDAKRLVRDRELGCYGGWGVDFWQPRESDSPPTNGTGAAGGPAGPSSSGGQISRYGLLAGSHIRELRSIDPQASEPKVTLTRMTHDDIVIGIGDRD